MGIIPDVTCKTTKLIMSRLEEFISTITDTELAIFIAYQFDGFINSSKQKLRDEVLNRGLISDKLSDLYKKGLSKPADKSIQFCPRCYSTKLFIETDHELRTVGHASYEVAVDTMRCRLCGYNPDKRKAENLLDALILKLVGNKPVRIPKQDDSVFKGL